MNSDARPTPAVMAGLQRPVPEALRLPTVIRGVLWVYVDNSNVWIEGQRIQAVREGMARDAYDAMNRKVFTPWTYDFGSLYEIAHPPGSAAGRTFLVGSRPPPNDSVWRRAEDEGFDVEVLDRNKSGKEKRVDSTIITKMLGDSYRYMQPDRGDTVVLVAGDGDYIPPIEDMQERGLQVRLIFWNHGVSRDLRSQVDEFITLDPYFDQLTWRGAPPIEN